MSVFYSLLVFSLLFLLFQYNLDLFLLKLVLCVKINRRYFMEIRKKLVEKNNLL